MTLPEKIYLPRAAARAHNLRQDGFAEHEYVRGDIYAAALAVNEALRNELTDYQNSFDLRHTADLRGIAMWRKAYPDRELTIPDHADLVSFLMVEVERLMGDVERLKNLKQTAKEWANSTKAEDGESGKSAAVMLIAEIESLKQPDTCTPIVPESEEWKFARAKVWEKWPGAIAVYFGDGTAREWLIWKRASDDFELGHGNDEESAWIDAASRLEITDDRS